MRSLRFKVWNIVLSFALVASSFVGLGTISPAYATGCNNGSGTAGNYFGGQTVTPGGWYLTGINKSIKAKLWSYNPSPVYASGFSTFWVMLQDGTNHDQVGWMKEWYDNTPFVFSEYGTNSNWTRRWYNAGTGSWGTNKVTQPSSNVEYRAESIYVSGSTYQFQNSYNGGTTQNLTLSWTPSVYSVDTEVTDYAFSGGVYKGTQVPGDANNKIQVNDIQFWDNVYGWTNGILMDSSPYSHTDQQGNAGLDTSNSSGIGFRSYDLRC